MPCQFSSWTVFTSKDTSAWVSPWILQYHCSNPKITSSYTLTLTPPLPAFSVCVQLLLQWFSEPHLEFLSQQLIFFLQSPPASLFFSSLFGLDSMGLWVQQHSCQYTKFPSPFYTLPLLTAFLSRLSVKPQSWLSPTIPFPMPTLKKLRATRKAHDKEKWLFYTITVTNHMAHLISGLGLFNLKILLDCHLHYLPGCVSQIPSGHPHTSPPITESCQSHLPCSF